MLYQALQPCRFDRQYLTGEFISGRVILFDMVDKLIAWGLIRPINQRDIQKEIRIVADQLKLWSKERLCEELQRVTGKEAPKSYAKGKLIQMILKAQVGDDYDQNISI